MRGSERPPAGSKRTQTHDHAGSARERIDDNGLHLTIDNEPRVLAVDTVVICAGQIRRAGKPLNERGAIRHRRCKPSLRARCPARV